MQRDTAFDVAILGAGPAGVTAASRTSELGASTCLITSGTTGGMAANDGPVPVRALARTARLIREGRQLQRYGVSVSDPRLDYPRVLSRVQEVVDSVRDSSLLAQLATQGVRSFEHAGSTRFLDVHTVSTESGLTITADKFIIATGGVSKTLPIPGFELTSTHSDVWNLAEVPESMIVVGGGATGIQVASIFNAFGSRIHLFEAGPRILSAEDHDTAADIADAFRQAGIEVREDFGSIESFEQTATGIQMNINTSCGREHVDATLAVVAVGWTADTGGLNLAAVGVDLTPRGFVAVDEHLRTTVPNIFAAGDVTGRVMLASEAIRDGFVAANNAVEGLRATVGHHARPTGSFTDPEYASIGLTEHDARKAHAVDCVQVPFTDNIRAIIDGQTFGFCKLVIDADTHEVLGCHVVGDQAIQIVQVVSAAFSAGMRRVDELARSPYRFPPTPRYSSTQRSRRPRTTTLTSAGTPIRSRQNSSVPNPRSIHVGLSIFAGGPYH